MSSVKANDTIQVAFACDVNYVIPLTVAMCSVATNCDSSRHLVFNVFQEGIDAGLRQKVELSLKRTGSTTAYINWLEAPIERFTSFPIVNRWLTPAALVRFLIPDLLPLGVNKVLYLDCDIVVIDNLSELSDIDVGGKSVLAARDSIGWVGNPDGGLSNYRELGIPSDAKYFNSGVLLLNVKKWRERGTSEHSALHDRSPFDHQI